MPFYFLFAWMALSGLVFLIPNRYKSHFSLVMSSILAVGVGFYALPSLFSRETYIWTETMLPGPANVLRMDGLSALFSLIIVWVSAAGTFYTKGYLSRVQKISSNLSLSLHYFAYLWLPASMILSILAVDGTSFLLGWELMTFSTFVLVLFEAYDRSKIQAAISYLVQMHICFFLLIIGFTWGAQDGSSFGWDGIASQFAASRHNLALFSLLFVAFGIKAGLFPLHTWLPMIHPKAGGNVSGLMSGIVIKMGIYGIARTLSLVQNDFWSIGVLVLSVGIITALYGIVLACLQKDLKRLLAYSSIENMGLICMGFGLGMLGKYSGFSMLAVAAFGGALLHACNHACYKSLLFFSAGSVLQATGTTNLNLLGGLSKSLPKLSIAFLIGALAICALPPFNGFVSEFMLYRSTFSILTTPDKVNLAQVSLAILSVFALAIVGGLSVMAFGKAFGIGFLGNARSTFKRTPIEPDSWSIAGMLFLIIPILAIGFYPSFFANITCGLGGDYFQLQDAIFTRHSITFNLYKIGIVGGLFCMICVTLWGIKKWLHKNKEIAEGSTWACGYHAPNARIQYTGSSFTDVFGILARPLQGYKAKITDKIDPMDLFPKKNTFKTHHKDWVHHILLEKTSIKMVDFFQRIEILQSGKVQYYVMMALLFIIALIFLSQQIQ